MSSDVMMFPATVEEFMEQYKIVDSDHVYTNGTELVPIFRMKQWFEHSEDMVEVVRCKDCKHWYSTPISDGYNSCSKDALIRGADFFCADGEKVKE